MEEQAEFLRKMDRIDGFGAKMGTSFKQKFLFEMEVLFLCQLERKKEKERERKKERKKEKGLTNKEMDTGTELWPTWEDEDFVFI